MSSLPSHRHQKMMLDKSAMPTRTGLQLPPNLPFWTWQRIGAQLHVITDSSTWWLGDWLVYGEEEYPDRYIHAISRTGLDYQTLRNYAWIARRFDISRRRGRLSFSHHAEVAALPESEQDYWLSCAEQCQWSRNRLRIKMATNGVRSGRRRPDDGTDELAVQRARRRGESAAEIVKINVPPARQERWREAADTMNRSLDDWIVAILDQAASVVLEVESDGNGEALSAARAQLIRST